MSVEYSNITAALELAATSVGATFNSISSTTPLSHSKKAKDGAGSKVTITLAELSVENSGRGGEHGDSLTTGNLVVTLRPTTASTELNLDTASALMDLAHRFAIKLDGAGAWEGGSGGVRATVQSNSYSAGVVTLRVRLAFGLVVVSKDTNDVLLGRI